MEEIVIERNLLPHERAAKNMLLARTGNACMADAAKLPTMHMLFDKFWHQGELCLLAGGTGAGKSLLGLQIADAISRGTAIEGFCMQAGKQKVLFFDTEHTDSQFANRYKSRQPDGGTAAYTFDDNLVRLVIDPQHAAPDYDANTFLLSLEEAIITHRARVLVLDSLTGLRNIINNYPRKELFILQRLKQLKERYKLSVLITAATNHRPGRRIGPLLTAGWRITEGFTDSIFAIGQSASHAHTRYLKQLKSRTARVTYHEHHVAVCEIHNTNGLTGFTLAGHGTEEQLQRRGETALERAIVALKKANPHLSLGEIANELGTYKMKVKRTLDSQWPVGGDQLPAGADGQRTMGDGAGMACELPEPEERCFPEGLEKVLEAEADIDWETSARGRGIFAQNIHVRIHTRED